MLFLLILFNIYPSQVISSGEAKPVKLSVILDHAVKNNRTLKEVKLTIKQLDSARDAASAVFDTRLSAKTNFVETHAKAVPGQFMNTTMLRKLDYELGISRVLPTGGIIGVTFSGYRQDQDMEVAFGGPPQVINSKVFSNNLTFMVSHPLLRGFGTEITKLNIEKATVNIEAEKISGQVKAEAMVRDIINAYWELRYAWKQWETLQGGIEVLKSQLKLTQALLTTGRAKTSDLLAVKAALAQRESDILSFRTSIVAASIKLKTLIGMDTGKPPWILKPGEELELPDFKVPENLITLAIKRSKDLAYLKKKIESLNFDMKAAENSMKPQLDLTVTAGPKGDNSEFSSSLSRLIKFEAFQVTAGLTFSMSVENSAAKATMAQVKVTKALMDLQATNLSQALAGSAVLAVETIRTALRKIKAGELSVKNAQIHLDNEKSLFEMGRGTNHSILLRLTELDQAKLTLLAAKKELIIAWTQIQALSGDLLRNNKISIPE